jgi:hypothetical protein
MLRNLKKSCNDDTLLTVDFNLRAESMLHTLQSPAGTTLWSYKVSSLRDFCEETAFDIVILRNMR